MEDAIEQPCQGRLLAPSSLGLAQGWQPEPFRLEATKGPQQGQSELG